MNRPVVAIISNSLTPYRLHFHLRLVREQPGVEWWSLFTHDVSNAPWTMTDEQEIRPVRFGQGERSEDQSKLSHSLHEYRKGGQITQWLKGQKAAAVILLGYNDLGRLRILRWCHRTGIPCFLFGDSNIRGDTTGGLKGRIKRWLLPRVLKHCAGALACGSLGREYFRKYGVSDDRIFYMPYEPEYALIQGLGEPEIDQQFQRLHLPRDRKYILFCGRLASVKRVDLLIDGFIAIAKKRPDWDLILLGDGPLRNSLETRVPTDLRSRVRWLGFMNNQRVIAAVQRGSQVLVLPSDYEPWGLVINEAVAAGCAVIATDAVGAAAELLHHGVNGQVIVKGAADEMAAALELTTETKTLGTYRSASLDVLKEWRRRSDPVHGLMMALQSANITPENATLRAASDSE